ncbi:hypothetical protein [Piscirickettsia salmonis]|nr:hypothetical protein [Piscirickettsia salmonis]
MLSTPWLAAFALVFFHNSISQNVADADCALRHLKCNTTLY